MAQVREIRLVDDMDGEAADETIEFGLDGKVYEIDLSEKNASTLRDAFAAFVAAGRRVTTGRGKATSSAARRPTTDREQNQAIREWAAKKGLKIAERGRIPSHIIEQFHREA